MSGFQSNAFQDSAFQVADAPVGGGRARAFIRPLILPVPESPDDEDALVALRIT